jgi:hypothetical protein
MTRRSSIPAYYIARLNQGPDTTLTFTMRSEANNGNIGADKFDNVNDIIDEWVTSLEVRS